MTYHVDNGKRGRELRKELPLEEMKRLEKAIQSGIPQTVLRKRFKIGMERMRAIKNRIVRGANA